jgi:glycosyltransferase involved in cell wall biosynthesis
MKKLLVVSHDFSLSGAPVALLNLVRGLSPHYEIRVVAPNGGDLQKDFTACSVDAQVVTNVTEQSTVMEEQVQWADQVLGNTIFSGRALYAARKQGKKSLWYLHEGLYNECMQRQVLVDLLLCATRVVLPSKPAAYHYPPVRDIDIIPYGVSLNNHESANEVPNILHLGSYEQNKGQHRTCMVLKEIQDQPYTAVFAGRCEVEPDYHHTVTTTYKDVPNITFLPQVDRSTSQKLVNNCDILVASSMHEVQPVVILEAMAAGKPVVASNVGGVSTLVEHAVTGYLYPIERPECYGENMRILLGLPALRAKMGAAARARARQYFSMESLAQRFMAVLDA